MGETKMANIENKEVYWVAINLFGKCQEFVSQKKASKTPTEKGPLLVGFSGRAPNFETHMQGWFWPLPASFQKNWTPS